MKTQILIGLGSNIEPEAHVPAAVRALEACFCEVRVSTLYRTRPLRGRQQAAYVNGVVSATTELSVADVRRVLREIEDREGRRRETADACAARTLDLDLLAYGDAGDAAAGLPSSDLLERDFVLIPAAELWPEFVHPVAGRPLRELAAERFPRPPNILGKACLLVAILLLGAIAALAGGGETRPAGAEMPLTAALPCLAASGLASFPSAGRIARSVIFICVASYLGLTAYLWLMQSRYVYYPTSDIEETPADSGLAFEDLWLDTEDGGRINAWFVPAGEGERGCVLFCHGNGGNIGHRVPTLDLFHRLGWSVLVFDYRGYGRSPGRPSEERTYRDAAAAWNYLTVAKGYAPGHIVLFGRSLGGSVAAWLAQERAAGGLIVESSFTSVPDKGQELYPYLPVRLLSRFFYDTRAYVAKAKCPVAILHSPDDTLIGIHHGRELYAAAAEPRQFIEISGDHNEALEVGGEVYVRQIRDALEWCLDARR